MLPGKYLYDSFLTGFGTLELTDDMISSAEALLINSLHSHSYESSRSTGSSATSSNVRTSSSAAFREHIKRAYLQTNMWINVDKPDRDILNHVENFGWKRSGDNIVLVMLPEN